MDSKRLRFREIELSDSEFIVNIRSDPEVYKYFLNPHKLTIEEHLNWFKNIYPKDIQRKDYIAIERDTFLKIGVFGLIVNDSTVEINYIIKKKFRQKGYAKEGIEYFLSYASKEFNCTTALAEIHKDNFASISLAKKLGFSVEAKIGRVLRFEKQI